MTKSRHLIRPRHAWTGAELDVLRRMFPDTVTAVLADVLGIPAHVVSKKAQALGLQKSPAFLASPRSGRTFDGRGAATRFQPGQPSEHRWKKGAQVSPETQFKPGERPVNCQEVGALRINSMGDLDIKVADGKGCWMAMRRYVWETEVGPIPAGMLVTCLNGDSHDTRRENLVLMTRTENIAHHLHLKYPKDLRSTMQLQGRLKNRIKALEGAQHG